MTEQETKLVLVKQDTELQVSPTPIEMNYVLVASCPGEMHEQQQKLIQWCDAKLNQISHDITDFEENIEAAKRGKFRTATFKRLLARTRKQYMFYEKMRILIVEGYHVIPNFPLDIFMIRVQRDLPKKKRSSYVGGIMQVSDSPQAGDGRYVDVEPFYEHRYVTRTDSRGEEHTQDLYIPTQFDEEIRFPFSLTKPGIIKSVNEAKKLHVFDEIGVLPQQAKSDPIIAGQIIDPRDVYHNRRITFLIVWFLDVRDL